MEKSLGLRISKSQICRVKDLKIQKKIAKIKNFEAKLKISLGQNALFLFGDSVNLVKWDIWKILTIPPDIRNPCIFNFWQPISLHFLWKFSKILKNLPPKHQNFPKTWKFFQLGILGVGLLREDCLGRWKGKVGGWVKLREHSAHFVCGLEAGLVLHFVSPATHLVEVGGCACGARSVRLLSADVGCARVMVRWRLQQHDGGWRGWCCFAYVGVFVDLRL